MKPRNSARSQTYQASQDKDGKPCTSARSQTYLSAAASTSCEVKSEHDSVSVDEIPRDSISHHEEYHPHLHTQSNLFRSALHFLYRQNWKNLQFGKNKSPVQKIANI